MNIFLFNRYHNQVDCRGDCIVSAVFILRKTWPSSAMLPKVKWYLAKALYLSINFVVHHTLQKHKVVVIDFICSEILIVFALIHFSEEKCCNCCNLM